MRSLRQTFELRGAVRGSSVGWVLVYQLSLVETGDCVEMRVKCLTRDHDPPPPHSHSTMNHWIFCSHCALQASHWSREFMKISQVWDRLWRHEEAVCSTLTSSYQRSLIDTTIQPGSLIASSFLPSLPSPPIWRVLEALITTTLIIQIKILL